MLCLLAFNTFKQRSECVQMAMARFLEARSQYIQEFVMVKVARRVRSRRSDSVMQLLLQK